MKQIMFEIKLFEIKLHSPVNGQFTRDFEALKRV